eukprot:Hpha_TRINITY_DN16273_c0_g9::TRINITY_DN16273_c0_g9_i1::g.13767::m.13767
MRGLLVVVSAVLAAGDSSAPTVTIPGIGAVEGSRMRGGFGVESFLGIPYAPPPVGRRRWQPPGPQPSWSGVRKATEFGASCPGSQCNWPQNDTNDSEDCLFLNVYRSTGKKAARRMPVMVWIHGGSYTTGCSNMYSGWTLLNQAQEGIVLVTINYRLGVFGFLGSDKLRAEDGSTGNFGFQDQRAALRWVRENIAAFGGDASRVTIFGESAGAGSVASHFVSRPSWPFFDHAIAESGAGAMWNTKPLDVAETVFNEIFSRSKCDTVNCLRYRAKAEDIQGDAKEGELLPGGFGYIPWSPVVDGVEFTDSIWALAEKGQVKQGTAVLGTNRDEDAYFMIYTKEDNNLTEARFENLTLEVLGEDKSLLPKVKALYAEGNYPYPKERGEYSFWWWAAMAVRTDAGFACPNRRYARNVKRAGVENIYNYFFVHPSQTTSHIFGTGPGSIVVPHASEIMFVFDCAYSQGTNISTCPLQGAGEQGLSEQFIQAWVSVAAKGVPGTVGKAEWQPWPKSTSVPYQQTSLQFDISTEHGGTGITVGGPAIDKQCDFWDTRMF